MCFVTAIVYIWSVLHAATLKEMRLLSEHHLSETAFFEILLSEKPQEKYEHVITLRSKSLKQCHKNFENWLTNKNFMQENIFE